MKRAQSTLEISLIIIAVVAALAGMGLYVQRSIKGNFKMTQDKINSLSTIKVRVYRSP